MSVVYPVVSSYNATVQDVQYPFAWTYVMCIVTFVLAYLPFVFPIKSAYSLIGRKVGYLPSHLMGDVVLSSIFFGIMLIFFLVGWAGYLSILGKFFPNGSVSAFAAITRPLDTFFLSVSSIILTLFLSVSIYRCIVMKSNAGALSITENELSKNEQDKRVFSGKTDTDGNPIMDGSSHEQLLLHNQKGGTQFDYRTYHANTDSISGNWCLIFLRIFMTLLCLYGFMIYVTIYPYSVDGFIFTIANFGIMATLTFITGILLTSFFLIVDWKALGKKCGASNDDVTSNYALLIGNTDTVTHSYWDMSRGFMVAGHVQTIQVTWKWIVSFFFFWYVTMYELTCSTYKADTATLCTWFVAFIMSILSQNSGTFLPFFFSALFIFTTGIYMLQYAYPPTNGATELNYGDITVNMNYMTTAQNCTTAAIQEDYVWMLVMSVFGFILACITVLESMMIVFKGRAAGKLTDVAFGGAA